jgi:hypothetical protein
MNLLQVVIDVVALGLRVGPRRRCEVEISFDAIGVVVHAFGHLIGGANDADVAYPRLELRVRFG